MLYINDRKKIFYLYNDVVDAVIDAGIDPKRAYIYLASQGVRGEKGRIISTSGMTYMSVIKLAVINNKLVTSVTTCDHCGSVSVA